jgi:hypothetical protein
MFPVVVRTLLFQLSGLATVRSLVDDPSRAGSHGPACCALSDSRRRRAAHTANAARLSIPLLGCRLFATGISCLAVNMVLMNFLASCGMR